MNYNRWRSRAFWLSVIWTLVAVGSLIIFLGCPALPVGGIIGIAAGVVTALMVTDKIKNTLFGLKNGVDNQNIKSNSNNSSNNNDASNGN